MEVQTRRASVCKKKPKYHVSIALHPPHMHVSHHITTLLQPNGCLSNLSSLGLRGRRDAQAAQALTILATNAASVSVTSLAVVPAMIRSTAGLMPSIVLS